MTANAQTNLSLEKNLSAVAQFRQGFTETTIKKESAGCPNAEFLLISNNPNDYLARCMRRA